MLHIILAILKILGILLAALLLFLLLALLFVLFVPLRYRLTVQKDTGGVLIKGKFTWLLRLIAISGGYQNAKPYVEFRILFLKKKLLPTESEDFEKPLKKKLEKPKRQKKMKKNNLLGTDRKKSPEPEIQTDCPPKSRDTYDTEKVIEQKQPDELKLCRQTSWFKRVPEKLSHLWRKISGMLRKILGILKNIPRNIQEFWKTLKKIFQKTGDFIGLLRSELAKTVFSHFRQHLKYLWKHLQPDRIQGELRYGFSDPAITGQLTGVLYLLLPVNCYKVRLEPDFEHAIYEGQIHICGHIRFWHFVRVAWKVFRDKEFRTLYRKFASGSLSV